MLSCGRSFLRPHQCLLSCRDWSQHQWYGARTRGAYSSSSSSSAATDANTSTAATTAYLIEHVKVDLQWHEGILDALRPVYGKDITVKNLESFGVEGLRALAASVANEQASNQRPIGATSSRPHRTIHFIIPHHSTEFDLKWRYGQSVLDVAKSSEGETLLGEYMEGTCGGQMSCCTCHVYVDSATLSNLPPPRRAELDMLDLAYEPKAESRLGCQVRLDEDLLQKIEPDQPIVITIPSDVNNVWN